KFYIEIKQCKNFDKFELGVILCVNIVIFIGCFISVSTRNYAYYWDSVREYSTGFGVEDWFKINTYTGIRNLFTTIRRDMRGPLGNVFWIIPFAFTDKTPDSWVLSIFFNIFPAFSFVYGIFLKNIQIKFKLKNNYVFYTANYFLLFSMPLLYRAYIYGFPDIFGVMFCLIIMICLFNLKFERLEFKKWVVVYAVTIILALLRDQYIVWIISFYICYYNNTGVTPRSIYRLDYFILYLLFCGLFLSAIIQ
ncbi:hypothetical protein, partial [Clostridium sp. AM58-1XD]|uniref:hypothetical protein n=1 Tax=Clostridium sp. AM58-1XD TaxID=2292307 RepID=UPI000EDA5825